MSNVLDTLYGGAAIFVLFFGALIGYYVFQHVMTTTKDPIGKQSEFEKFFAAIDNVAIFLFFGFSFAAVVSAYLIRAHPIFLGLSVLIIFVEFLIFPQLVNVYNQVGSGTFPSSVARFSNATTLMNYLPIWTAVAAFIAAVVAVARGE